MSLTYKHKSVVLLLTFFLSALGLIYVSFRAALLVFFGSIVFSMIFGWPFTTLLMWVVSMCWGYQLVEEHNDGVDRLLMLYKSRESNV